MATSRKITNPPHKETDSYYKDSQLLRTSSSRITEDKNTEDFDVFKKSGDYYNRTSGAVRIRYVEE